MSGSAWSNQVVNQVIIVGPNGKLLVYNTTTVTANSLIASILGQQTTDAAGNLALAGITGYSHSGGSYFATQVGGGGSSNVVFYQATTEAGPWTVEGSIIVSSTEMQLSSTGGMLFAPGSGAAVETLPSGLSGTLPVFQLDRTPLSVGNSTTTTDLTNTWDIPAGDAANGAKYTIRGMVKVTSGNATAETLTVGLDLNSGTTLVPLATLGASFNGSALNTTYAMPFELVIVPGAGNVAADAEIVLLGSLGDTSANRLSANTANMSGYSDTTAFATASDNKVALYVVWGGTGGTGQAAACNWSSFTREGN